jgi:tRNA A-37 threonylcarbamoyl transferase component Bud32
MSDAPVHVLRDGGWAQRLQACLPDPAEALDHWFEGQAQILKRDAHSTVGLLPLDGETHFVKIYRPKAAWQRWGFRLGRGRGIHAYDAALRLQAAGIRVAEPQACLLLPGSLLLMTEALPGEDLKSLWLAGDEHGRDAGRTATAGCMSAAGAALGALHRGGHAHGDCKWSNLLYVRGQVFFTDLEAVAAIDHVGPRALRDLARFTLNAEDLALPEDLYQAFLDAYLQTCKQSRRHIVACMLPILDELRARHRERYGSRGHRLIDG